MTCLCCLVVGSVFLFPHDGSAGRNAMVYLVTKQLKYPLQRSSDDGGDGRWRSYSRLSIAPCGVGAHALYTVAQSIVKTATLEGGRCFLIRLPPSAFRAHRFPTSTNPNTMSMRLSWIGVILSDAMIVGDRPQARLTLRGPFPTRPQIRPPRLQSSCSLRRRVQVGQKEV